MNEVSMNDVDPTEPYEAGIVFSGDTPGSYGGKVEVTASTVEFPDRDPELRVSVYLGDAMASLRRSMSTDQLRELAGALKRAADHTDVVRREVQRKSEVVA